MLSDKPMSKHKTIPRLIRAAESVNLHGAPLGGFY